MGPSTKLKPNHSRKKSENLISQKTLGKPIHTSRNDDTWAPNIQTAFKALASARLCAAVWNNINDCDETYNYWEPLHYLLYGSGFQTWEYSPVYALRSYTYLLVHALPAWIYGLLLQSNRVLIFYFMRCILGFVCTTFETYFYSAVLQQFGPRVGRLTLAFLLFSAGMFQASTSFLPSSFSMYMCLVSMGAWLNQHHALAIFTTALSTFLSWPFAGILGLGIAVDVLLVQKKWKMFMTWCFISTLIILGPMILLDSYMYGRLAIPPLNIVLYNIFSEHGPDLYGTSPWTFYFLNGFLNFNVVYPLALAVLPAILVTIRVRPIRSQTVPVWLALVPLYAWILIFFTQPHKEERFLYPIYPLIALAAAMTWTCVESFLGALRLPAKWVQWLTLALVISSSAVSVSRVIGQYKGFHASMDVFMELSRLSWEANEMDTNRGYNVCVGKEWHRFPSSFFLPNNWKLLFLPSEFRGQLPRPFDPPPDGTRTIPPHMNDLNREEPSRYASLKECHFLIDLDTAHSTEREPRYSQSTADWQVIHQLDFVDAANSPQLLRAFYVPWFSETYCRTNPYVLLKRKTEENAKSKKMKKVI